MADNDSEKVQISLAQVAASSLAAVSAAVVCSFFGIAGTIIGTAIASVCATVGSALYAHSLRRTRSRLRQLHQAGAVSPPLTEVIKTTRQQWRRWFGEVPWRRVGLGTGAAFVAALVVVTAIELGIGEPLSALFGVSHDGSRTSTLGSVAGFGSHRKHHKSHPKPTPSDTSPAASSSSASPAAPSTHSASATPSSTPTRPPSTTPVVTPSVSPTTISPSP